MVETTASTSSMSAGGNTTIVHRNVDVPPPDSRDDGIRLLNVCRQAHNECSCKHGTDGTVPGLQHNKLAINQESFQACLLQGGASPASPSP